MDRAKDNAEAATHRTRGRRFEHLDMLRALAALLVLIGHARGFVLLDYSQLSGPKLYLAPLYFVAGLGHQAVVLFFALSGFLVGGRALREIGQGRWNLPDYAVHRFARLWTALIPALVATALLDWIGRDLLHLAGYAGEYGVMLASGPVPGERQASTLATFLGNIFFLQTIAVPVFGTNGPLWSLANEFWYYFLFPFAWMALVGRVTLAARLAAAAFATAAVFLLPTVLLLMGAIWVIGALAWIGGDRVAALSTARFRFLFAAALLAVVVGLAASLARPGLASDIALGIACAVMLPCLARLRNPGGLYGRVTFWTSEFSFTLYVVHFPLIALLAFAFVVPTQFAPSLAGFAALAGLVTAAIAFAWVMWWAFERNTPRVRRRLLQSLRLGTR